MFGKRTYAAWQFDVHNFQEPLVYNQYTYSILRRPTTDAGFLREGKLIHTMVKSPRVALEASTTVNAGCRPFSHGEVVLVRNETTGHLYMFRVSVGTVTFSEV